MIINQPANKTSEIKAKYVGIMKTPFEGPIMD